MGYSYEKTDYPQIRKQFKDGIKTGRYVVTKAFVDNGVEVTGYERNSNPAYEYEENKISGIAHSKMFGYDDLGSIDLRTFPVLHYSSTNNSTYYIQIGNAAISNASEGMIEGVFFLIENLNRSIDEKVFFSSCFTLSRVS